MAENNVNNASESIFRKKTLERISSPEQLTDYLRITNPGIWVILTAVILLLGGLFAWAMIGTLETTAEVRVVVTDDNAEVVSTGNAVITEDMIFRINSTEYVIAYTAVDDYGRVYGMAAVDLPDGSYEGTAVIEQIHPIQFLLTSN
jgi:hypothetical protein